MTIQESSNQLFAWFSEKESFNLDHHADKEEFFGAKKPSRVELASLMGALEDFEKMDLVKKVIVEGQSIFVLKKSFEAYDQTIKLSPETCNSISQFVNGFCDVVQNVGDKCDAKSISEKDIKNLLVISTSLFKLSTGNKTEEQE